MSKGSIWKYIAFITVFITTTALAVAQPDTARIAQLLNTGSEYLQKQGDKDSGLDSAQFFFDQALALSKSIRSDKWINSTLELKGECYLKGDDLSRGKACFQKVIDNYHRKGDQRSEAMTWKRFGECIPKNQRFAVEKANCYGHAWRLYSAVGDTPTALEALKNEADAHLYVPDLDLAEKELLAVIEGYKAIHYCRLHYTYDLLRGLSKNKGDLVKGVFYAMQMIRSIDITDTADDRFLIDRLYMSASHTFAQAGLFDRALFYARKGWPPWKVEDTASWSMDYYLGILYLATDLVNIDSAGEALSFVSSATRQVPSTGVFQQVMLLLARGRCYTAVGDYKNAEKDFSDLGVFVKRSKTTRPHFSADFEIETILGTGINYLLSHQYEKADAYARQLPADGSKLVSLYQWVRIERFLAKVDSARGRYDQALRHFEIFQRVSDSLFSVQKGVLVQELQIKYATEEKDKDLRIQAGNIQLLTKQNQLQQAQVARSRVFRNMMIGGLLILLLLVGLVYNRYRLKQQKNRQLEAKQKEITEKNHQLERLLTENEWLLREVHHRVKNNLQVIISLLKSQSDFLHDKAALAAVVESEHRVYAMSLIHQKLYKSSNVSSINMPEYIGDLVEYLRYSFAVSGKLWFDLQVEPINLDLQQAVPVGLILNEVITNSFKYAFPCSDEDKITVRLFAAADGFLSLIIADNGRGLPPNYDPGQHNSFGMLLIGGLTEDLEGTLHIETRQGTAFHIRFKPISLRSISEDGSQGSGYFNK